MMTRTQLKLGAAIWMSLLTACHGPQPYVVPAVDYSEQVTSEESNGGNQKTRGSRYSMDQGGYAVARPAINRQAIPSERAGIRMASASGPQPMAEFGAKIDPNSDTVTNMGSAALDPSVVVQDSSSANTRPYIGPLSLGDPGTAASLWKESRSANDFFRDDRAWQPMDLLTIVVSEKSQGSKNADTEVKTKATVSASIPKFLGVETWLKDKNKSIDPSALVEAATQNDSKGEADTSRSGSLVAKISAMVVEVLPSGVLRVEGQKIISVNSEDEIMVISGLVKPTDVSSANEIDSAKIANMRIDYYGEGNVGDAAHGGWMGNFMHRWWPF